MRLYGCFHSSGFGWFHFSSVVVVLVVVVAIVWLFSLFLCSLVSLFLPRPTVDSVPKLSLSDFPLLPFFPTFSASFNPSSGPKQRAVCWHLIMAILSSQRKLYCTCITKFHSQRKPNCIQRVIDWEPDRSLTVSRKRKVATAIFKAFTVALVWYLTTRNWQKWGFREPFKNVLADFVR